MKQFNVFNRITALLSVSFTFLGAIGLYAKPSSSNLILMTTLAFLVILLLFEKIRQIHLNTDNIIALNSKLQLEKRFASIEVQLAEIRGKE